MAGTRKPHPVVGQFILVDEDMDQASLHPTEANVEEELVDVDSPCVFYIAKIIRAVRMTNPAPILEDL